MPKASVKSDDALFQEMDISNEKLSISQRSHPPPTRRTILSLVLSQDPLHQEIRAANDRLRRATMQARQACRPPTPEPDEADALRLQIQQLQQRLTALEATHQP